MRNPPYRLLESLYVNDDAVCPHYERHRQRLEQTARVFHFMFDGAYIDKQVKTYCQSLDKACKLRLELRKDGVIFLNHAPLNPCLHECKYICFSSKIIHSDDICFHYKTTNRHLYESELSRIRKHHPIYDVIFMNQHGYVTEGSYNNIIIREGSYYKTPPLSAGLLNGIGRQIFMEDHHDHIIECPLTQKDIDQADDILLVNSVRGVVSVRIMPHA